MSRNLFTSPSSYDFSTALAELQLLGIESSRVEYKEQFETNKSKIVRAACSLANAFGGLIAIGFKDPDRNDGQIGLAEPPYEVSERTTTSIVNSILSNTYPSVESECFVFQEAGSRRGFYLVRVRQSESAPHSLTVDNSFPVRRHNLTGTLSLSEIEGLMRRRDSVPEQSAYRPGPSYLSITRSSDQNAPNFFGIEVTPKSPLRKPKRLDENEIRRVLTYLPTELGLYDLPLQSSLMLCDVRERSPQNYYRGKKMIHVDASGEFVLRFLETTDNEWWQYVHALGVAYSFGSLLWQNWGISPIATVRVEIDLQRARLSDNAMLGQLPNVYSDYISVDFSEQSFVEAFLDLIVRTESSANKRGSTEFAENTLNSVWENSFDGIDVQSGWNRI